MHRLVFIFGLVGCLHGVPDDLEVTPPPAQVPPPLPEEPDPTPRTAGPLRSDPPAADTTRLAIALQRDASRRLSADDRAADLAIVDELITQWSDLDPKAARDAHLVLARLGNRASVADFANTITSATKFFDGCVRPFADVTPCGPAVPRGELARAPAISLEHDGEVAVLTVRDFDRVTASAGRDSDAKGQGYEIFDPTQLGSAKAVVLDLTAARGGRVAWILPWLETLAGAPWRKPLRAAVTVARAAQDVSAYRRRFLPDTARDLEEWAALVDSANQPARLRAVVKHPIPIEILVDRGCESACELVTRMLETYAGARVYGAAAANRGRLVADNPARIVLPRSKITIYYYATRYELAPAIVDATGPTAGWATRAENPPGIEFAIGDAVRWLSHPEVDCGSLPALTREQLSRLDTFEDRAFGATRGTVMVTTSLSVYALRRIARRCGWPRDVDVRGGYGRNGYVLHSESLPEVAALSRLAQYPGVTKVRAERIPEYRLD